MPQSCLGPTSTAVSYRAQPAAGGPHLRAVNLIHPIGRNLKNLARLRHQNDTTAMYSEHADRDRRAGNGSRPSRTRACPWSVSQHPDFTRAKTPTQSRAGKHGSAENSSGPGSIPRTTQQTDPSMPTQSHDPVEGHLEIDRSCRDRSGQDTPRTEMCAVAPDGSPQVLNS